MPGNTPGPVSETWGLHQVQPNQHTAKFVIPSEAERSRAYRRGKYLRSIAIPRFNPFLLLHPMSNQLPLDLVINSLRQNSLRYQLIFRTIRAILDDPLRVHIPNPENRLELALSRRVDVDRSHRRIHPRHASVLCRSRRKRPSSRHNRECKSKPSPTQYHGQPISKIHCCFLRKHGSQSSAP